MAEDFFASQKRISRNNKYKLSIKSVVNGFILDGNEINSFGEYKVHGAAGDAGETDEKYFVQTFSDKKARSFVETASAVS